MNDRPSQRQSLPLRKRVLYYGILLLVPCFVIFVAFELYLRISRTHVDLWVMTGRKAGPNVMAHWAVGDPYSAYRVRPGGYRTKYAVKTVNQHGFISTPELTISKPQGTIRIAFLGESSTAGTGRDLKDKDTWPWQVWNMLQERVQGKKIEFINGALGGYTSFESYGRLWSRIRFFSPDIIVVCHGWNEMYYFDQVDKITSFRLLQDGSWTLDRHEAVAIYEPRLIDYLIRPSQVLVRLRVNRFTWPDNGETSSKHKGLLSKYDARALGVWRTHLRLFRETARQLGSQLFVVKQATLITPNFPVAGRQRCPDGTHGFDDVAHIEAFKGIYCVIDEELAADHTIDATILSGNLEHFYDCIHPTEKGAYRIAEIVSDVLLTYLKSHGQEVE